ALVALVCLSAMVLWWYLAPGEGEGPTYTVEARSVEAPALAALVVFHRDLGPVTSQATGVVTSVLVPAGEMVGRGRALLHIDGRPVIAMTGSPGSLATELAPGDSGPDVVALQAALADEGRYRGD